MNRRSFIGSVIALSAAPSIVRASSLMPIWVPRSSLLELPPEDQITLGWTNPSDRMDNIKYWNGVRVSAEEQKKLARADIECIFDSVMRERNAKLMSFKQVNRYHMQPLLKPTP